MGDCRRELGCDMELEVCNIVCNLNGYGNCLGGSGPSGKCLKA